VTRFRTRLPGTTVWHQADAVHSAILKWFDMEHSEHVWGHEPEPTSDAVTPPDTQQAADAPHATPAPGGDAARPDTVHESVMALTAHDAAEPGVPAHAHHASASTADEAISAPPSRLPGIEAPVTEALSAPRPRDWGRVRAEVSAGFQTLISAAVYATLIVTFGFQVARVDGLSMAPTLEDRDRLIVNKMVYELGDPRPGDIVMLYYPLNPDKMFVKRVIASEGDVVRIVDGRVYVNDLPLHDDYVPEEFRSHDDWGPKVIDQGYYFVMGDHRNNSSDSRHWGLVPKKYIVGKVKLRFWPLHDARIF
jgi:signal peptidase I